MGLNFRSVLPLAIFILSLCALAGARAQTPGNPQPQPQTLLLQADAERADIRTVVQVLEDPTGQLTLDDVRSPAYAGRFAAGQPSGGADLPVHWVRFTVRHASTQPMSWWFSTGTQFPKTLDLYTPDAQGIYRHQHASADLPFASRPLPFKHFVFPVELQPRQPTTVYLRLQGYSQFAVIQPVFWEPATLTAAAQHDRAQWLLYVGMAASIILYNLLLFTALRDSNYLFYAAASTGIVWAVSSALGGFGFAFEMLWPDSPRFERTGWALSMSVSHLLVVTFFAQVLEMRHRMADLHKWLLRACALFTLGVLATLAIYVGGDHPGARRIVLAAASVAGIAMSVIVLFALVRAAKARSRTVVFIVIAWLPLIIASTPFTIGMLTQTPSDNRLLIWASIFEMLMMSLLLADKFNQEKRAKSIAQTALVDHLKKSEQELESKVAQRTDELSREQTRTKELLHNILPVDIAQEISSTGSARPARHEAATILFTDFSGFTVAVATMPADRMVAELNEIFAAFDDITDACGVEKIKTIGDAYMAVAGLPKPCADHAQRCVRAGRLMLAYLEERNINAAFKWQLRIGIHSGPVVAGVVGKRKYAFDIWGDAVNIASRMESSGEVGRVNVSAYTYDLIRGEFQCEYRGKVGAKGKGEVDMYFVAGGVT